MGAAWGGNMVSRAAPLNAEFSHVSLGWKEAGRGRPLTPALSPWEREPDSIPACAETCFAGMTA